MSSSASDDDAHLPKLSEDIVVDHILKRLPVRSLLRFRCVCRSWRSTIDGSRFVDLHLSHSALDASSRYLACLDWCDPFRSLCSLYSGVSLTPPSKSHIEIPFAAPPNCYGFVGSCNGLICVTEISRNGYRRSMYLWNLFTRKHKAVPRSSVEKKFLTLEIPRIAVGFGFSNDYKIVRIYPLYRRGTKPQVEIYSLSTGCWRSLDCEVPTLSVSRPAVFLSGNLHWFASKSCNQWDEVGYQQIVSFDVTDEVFDKMALPEEISHVDSVDLVSLAVLNDLLAVLISRRAEQSGCSKQHSVCSVWVMRDYGMLESWTKLYTFEASGLVTGFDGFTLNGELLMKIHGGKRVCWNLITGHEANLQSSMACDLVTVVESLVSV
ncbi:hypothetical protein ACJRO7_033814 [Eucalyptus globulus]|uniref:F-box domain-containing protein n=1 Tax=Eucalyptus globulus TaxID=34317 RepID=A0ABD3J4T8_EUCGL